MSVTWVKGDEWWLSYRDENGDYRYPEHIDVGDLDNPVRYIPAQRYKQLQQVAREMVADLEAMVCFIPYATPDRVNSYRNVLRELGVSLDD